MELFTPFSFYKLHFILFVAQNRTLPWTFVRLDMWLCKPQTKSRYICQNHIRDQERAQQSIYHLAEEAGCREQPFLSNQPFEISNMPLNFSNKHVCALQQLPSLLWPGQSKMAS